MFALDPTPTEQESMQLINRFRTDPLNEFSRLIASVSPRRAVDPNVDFSLNFFNTNVSIVQTQLAALSPVPPIAWDEIAQQVAVEYLPYMAGAKSAAHNLNGTFQQRIQRYPFDFSRGGTAKENAFLNAFSPIHAHAAYVIDWGNGPNGLQASGHRNNLISSEIKSGGMAFMAVTYEPTTGFGPNLNVQDLMGLGATQPTVTGAVFQDRNSSGWYDAGEGLAGVQLVFRGSSGEFVINAMSAGGYNAVVPAGTYTVTASGGGIRFPITKSNVVVGSQNVWLNFLYDPTSVPADAYESNNSVAAATALTGNDQTLSDGTISQGDLDYFRLPTSTSGLLNVRLNFVTANGDLDLRLLDAAGNTLASSTGGTAEESINFNVNLGVNYYFVVESHHNGIGGPYTLQIDVPAAQAPDGRADTITTSLDDAPTVIDVLGNDRDADGDLTRASVTITNRGHGTLEPASSNGRAAIRYTPVPGFVGIDRFSYVITDQQGLVSGETSVEVMVLDFTTPLPFQNAVSALDVNSDGVVTPVDALLAINQLNLRRSGVLPRVISQARELFGYVDVNGSGTLEPMDILLIINGLNSKSSGEGEGAVFELAFAPDWLALKTLIKNK